MSAVFTGGGRTGGARTVLGMDDETRDKLVDLYTQHGDQLTPARAATRGIGLEFDE